MTLNTMNQADALDKTGAQRMLVIGGLLLILAGMIFGDVFAVFILHPNADEIGNALYDAAEAVSLQEPGSVPIHFMEIGDRLENRGTKVDTHVHAIKLGYLALLLALVQPFIALGNLSRRRLAQLFLTGAVVMPPSIFLIHYAGLAYSPFKTIGWASIFADLGGLLVIIACIGELAGLCFYFRNGSKQDQGTASDLILTKTDQDSRLLLIGGTLMLLAGFLFGAWYAAVELKGHESREVEILRSIVEMAASDQMESVEQSLDDYGLLQAERAVTIAAHAHINEFGMLAILLAFVQPYVFLRPAWRRRWIIVMLTGSVVLPVSVYLELEFGLIAGGAADIGGLLVIIALFGMLAGVVRHTGRIDAAMEGK